jgi:hypothetical protein
LQDGRRFPCSDLDAIDNGDRVGWSPCRTPHTIQLTVAIEVAPNSSGYLQTDSKDTRYVGGAFGWLSPFALLCGLGLCFGYALLGAGWLTYKTAADVQTLAFRLLPRLTVAVLGFLAVAFVAALVLDLRVMHRWLEAPVLAVFPLIGVVACVVLSVAIRRRVRDARGLVLSVHGALLDHDRGCRIAPNESVIHVLGRWCVRPTNHTHLRARHLFCLQRQSR